eukprot:scaffold14690_cov72-Skeletonema_dohrnii-CCMP3373.AAC.1
MQQSESPRPSTTMPAAPPLPRCERTKTKTFSLIDMVPDFEKITIDEEDITEETEEMINHCAVECPNIDPKTCDEADSEEKIVNNDPTNSANRRPSGRRAVHPLKSSLRSSSTSTASTISTSMMDESSTSTIMMDESQSSMRRRDVCFTSLEIRSYGVTLVGNANAPTFHGPPVSL